MALLCQTLAPVRLAVPAALIGSLLGSSSSVLAQPTCLFTIGTTLYRINADATGAVEVFPNQPWSIIGMTVVPEGAAVPGCTAGDVIAVQEGGQRRMFRIANARRGTPSFVQIGNLPNNVSSICFAQGRFYGITSGALLREFNTSTFTLVGTPVDLSSTAGSVGGVAFLAGQWYYAGAGRNGVVRVSDPPTAESAVVLEPSGIDFDGHGLEAFNEQLWLGAIADETVHIGVIDTTTGALTTEWQFPLEPLAGAGVGFVAFTPACSADVGVQGGIPGADGVLDNNDFIAFIDGFFTLRPGSDRGSAGGAPGADGVFDNNDFIVYIGLFFAGCE